MNGATVAFRGEIRGFPLREKEPLNCVGLKFQASTYDPCLCFIHRSVWEEGVVATHPDDILGYGEPGFFGLVRRYLERRFGPRKFHETNFTSVGIYPSQAKDFSVVATQGTLLGRGADRRRPLLRCGPLDNAFS